MRISRHHCKICNTTMNVNTLLIYESQFDTQYRSIEEYGVYPYRTKYNSVIKLCDSCRDYLKKNCINLRPYDEKGRFELKKYLEAMRQLSKQRNK